MCCSAQYVRQCHSAKLSRVHACSTTFSGCKGQQEPSGGILSATLGGGKAAAASEWRSEKEAHGEANDQGSAVSGVVISIPVARIHTHSCCHSSTGSTAFLIRGKNHDAQSMFHESCCPERSHSALKQTILGLLLAVLRIVCTEKLDEKGLTTSLQSA